MFVGVTASGSAVVSCLHERVLLALRTQLWLLKQGIQVDNDSFKTLVV